MQTLLKSLAALMLWSGAHGAGPSEAYEKLWSDPEVSRRIERDIEQHRKSEVEIRFIDAAGKPLTGVTFDAEQTSHDFLFGANLFMLGCYPTARENAAYEKAFVELFNAGTVPFYWRAYETERGVYRFATDSPPSRRRPPPDAVLAFCEKHGLTPHGHTLVWDNPKWSIPDWLPADLDERARCIESWVQTLGSRYGGRIHKWDVLNEPMYSKLRKPHVPMPPGYEVSAFKSAERHFPAGTRFFLNEATQVWTAPQTEAYCQLIESYREQGAKIAAVGMQFHFFKPALMQEVLDGKKYAPQELFAALDRIGELGLPIHISEITLPSNPNDAPGQAGQAAVARNYYRLWFSHPNIESITWWNVPDGAAAAGETHLDSGLLNADLTPKPAYTALRDLIHREWKTRFTGESGARAGLKFRGFHGTYRYTARAGGETMQGTFHLQRGAKNQITIRRN